MNILMKLLADNRGKGFFKADPIKNANGHREATLYIYDAIVSDDYWGGVAATTFVKALAEIEADVIHLRINSPGGEVFAAQAMAQAIREKKSHCVAHVDGYAASAASFLALAADEVVISEGGFFMIHNANTIAFGNASDLRETADLLDKVDGTLVDTYAHETGQDAKQIRDWMQAETWFTAQEAVANGFADSIASGDKTTAKSSWNLSAYAKAPKMQISTPIKGEADNRLNGRQVALLDELGDVVEQFGKFDHTTSADGAHYVVADQNPFKDSGLKCANCMAFEGGRTCELVTGDIDPDAICKLWVIPVSLISAGSQSAPNPAAQATAITDHLRRRLSVAEAETA